MLKKTGIEVRVSQKITPSRLVEFKKMDTRLN